MQAVIFDLDGTLVDTLDDLTHAINHVLAADGLPAHDRDTVRSFVGNGARALVERSLPPDRRDQTDEWLARFREYYAAHALDRSRPYPGIVSLLDVLTVPLAVLSNKPNAETRTVVFELFGETRFRVVLGQREGIPKKPDPTAALEIASLLEADADRIVFVGDTPVDMETAVSAGMLPVGVSWGFRDAELLRRAGATTIADDASELADELRSLLS